MQVNFPNQGPSSITTLNKREKRESSTGSTTPENSHQTFYNTRKDKLSDLFQRLDYPLSNLVTEDEMLGLLDTLGRTTFDREVASQLFDKVIGSRDTDRFSIEEFIDVHIKAEYLLLLQLEEINDDLNHIRNEIKGLETKHYKTLHDPKALVESNSLQVDVIQVVCDEDQYEPSTDSKFSVILLVGEYKYETEEVTSSGPKFNLQFDRTFHLRVKSPDEMVRILLRDHNRYKSDSDYQDLKCTIRLNSYTDRITHLTWLDLYNRYNQPTKFKVNIVVKWSFSKISDSEERLNRLSDEEAKLKDEKVRVEFALRTLTHPFTYLDSQKERPKPLAEDLNVQIIIYDGLKTALIKKNLIINSS